MLDYDLVTGKARYRMPGRDDMPELLRLADACATRNAVGGTSRDRMLETVRELSRHPDRGSVFLFEREQDLVGYCVLVTHWSNVYGGNVLRIDELYIEPGHSREGIAEDFFELLSRVAPPGTCAIQLDASAADKGMIGLCARAGFESRNGRIMTRPIQKDSAAGEA